MNFASLAFKFGPYIALALMTALYLGKRDDLATEIEASNTRIMTSIAEAERITRETTQRAATARIAQVEAMAFNAAKARDIATRIAQSANMNALKAGQRIRELELEASIDEIPDSGECLNVFLPARVFNTEDCAEALSSRSGSHQICAGTEGINPENPAFSTLTFGDSIRLWAQDRAGLTTCNAQLVAIEAL